MEKPKTPPDETARLDALRSLQTLDTMAEERFDRITRMAKRLFEVPIAVVSLVDEDRVWFKSCIGLATQEMPRGVSFCGHAILGDGIFTIEDTTLDARFADNPVVTGEPYIRFYAGCPLMLADGSKLGTLCILDTQPRTLSEDDLSALRDLAAVVESELSAVHMATVDELTDISNRRGFHLAAKEMLRIGVRQRMPTSLIFLDLNNFKQVNDAFGHQEGDRALVRFSACAKRMLRHSDLVARIGGDEFVILLNNTDYRQAQVVVDKLRQTLLDVQDREGDPAYETSFSCGIVEYDPQKHETTEDLLAEGDTLMYTHKKRQVQGPAVPH